ncbi:hypothetical protein FJZ19_04245 [Candidatus Pacearchaeota archaeon]|nr:hypothetical protein [Candidatus Pacearchaeota archaeon]
MNKKEIILLISVSVFVFIIVYSPHFNYHFPFHIDEWHSIAEAIKLGKGEYAFIGHIEKGTTIKVTMGYEVGFHALLYLLSLFINLVNFYQFFPALWAAVSALTLFFVLYKKTGNFKIAVFSMIFFASLKSNVNLGGVWFFTPLTFSIPFIFLYVYFFTEGIEKQNKKFILASLLIMCFLIFVHVVSVLFAVPFLFIYALIHYKYLIKEWKFFSFFLILPVLGILFYSYMNNFSIFHSLGTIMDDLVFKKGWGVLELKNSPLEVYSYVGYILAFFGAFFIVVYKSGKKYLPYLLWPATLIISIIIFRIFGVSYLSPYQRNIYYFAISLPFLSSFGLNYILNYIKLGKNSAEIILKIIILAAVFLLAFWNYYYIPKNIELYRAIDNNDYSALKFLANMPRGKVMAPLFLSEAIYPVSGNEPAATLFFYGNRTISKNFFDANNCSARNKILTENNISYFVSKARVNCGWKLIYSSKDYIYKVK